MLPLVNIHFSFLKLSALLGSRLEITWLWSTQSYSTAEVQQRAWKLQGSLQDTAAHWGSRWLRPCWKTAQRVSLHFTQLFQESHNLNKNQMWFVTLLIQVSQSPEEVENVPFGCSVPATRILKDYVKFKYKQNAMLLNTCKNNFLCLTNSWTSAIHHCNWAWGRMQMPKDFWVTTYWSFAQCLIFFWAGVIELTAIRASKLAIWVRESDT